MTQLTKSTSRPGGRNAYSPRSALYPSLPSIDPTVETWRDKARCRALVVSGSYSQREIYEIFFPTRYSDPKLIALARDICSLCPVKAECLAEAIDFKQYRWGIQGGMTADERRTVISGRRKKAAATFPPEGPAAP